VLKAGKIIQQAPQRMKVCGLTIIRNALTYDYPVTEAILSVLPLCDEFIVLVGQSNDQTRRLIEQINSPKIKIYDSFWDDTKREGGLVLSEETNKALDLVPAAYDWCFYIQSDECVHEEDYDAIRDAMKTHLNNEKVQGLLFKYKHFYGSYNYIGAGRRWYSHEIRIIRNSKTIRSYKDAQGFRTNANQKLIVAPVNAFIYHYGWVKPPSAQQTKQKNFHKMWHSDDWIQKNVGASSEYDYSNIDFLEEYKGTHPSIYAQRIKQAKWAFTYHPDRVNVSLKNKILHIIEKIFGWRPGENKNYEVLKN